MADRAMPSRLATLRPYPKASSRGPRTSLEGTSRGGGGEGLALGAELWPVADAHPADMALVDGDVRLTYSGLVARADAAGHRAGRRPRTGA